MPLQDHADLKLANRMIHSYLADKEVRVQLFGSRARGDSRNWSDIDVAVQASPALPAAFWAGLREALEECDCLLHVNVVDWNDADVGVRESISCEGIEWPVYSSVSR